jgi:DNA helicase-2/ATP-dependent DNA helicase PcrA
MTPTEEQTLIISQAASPRSLLINALAGAAKTSTLAMMAKKLPLVPTICLAFNKRTAVEMQQRMPSHILCSTLNSVGHKAWASATGKRLRVETGKSYGILKDISDKLSPSDRKAQIGDQFAMILKAVGLCKSAGYVPEKYRSLSKGWISGALILDTFSRQLDADPSDEFLALIDQILEYSIAQSYEGTIDFDDQIYMSALFGGAFTKYPIILVDEAQDLSPLNHLMLERMYAGRVIAVGDPNQAIYAFRGASHNSMAELKDKFDMQELTLSISFRCPRTVVENVHWHVPHMRFPDWAVAGSVVRTETWNSALVPDGSAIICRNNAPLFKIGIALLKKGRGIKILGNDIGANLIKVLEKLGPGDTPRQAVFDLIDKWEQDSEKKARKARIAAIKDKADCLRVFAEAGQTLDEAIAYAKAIFSSAGPIQLMTGHKSKGGEWDTVFHLDSYLVPSKGAWTSAELGDESQLIQERNLKYVIDTRAKQTLYYVNSGEFQ